MIHVADIDNYKAIPEKNAISYIHDDGTSPRAIRMYDLSTGDTTTLTECRGHCEHHWSPDGETLFFTHVVHQNRHRAETLYSLKNSDILSHPFNIPHHIRSFTVSENAVYAVIEDGDAPRIYRTFLENGAQPELVYPGNTYELIEDLTWLGGNRFVAAVSDADSRLYDLYEFIDDGQSLHSRRLTFTKTTEMYPFKQPDGNIGYIVNKNGFTFVHSLNPDTGDDRVIHAQSDNIFQPVESEDEALYYTIITADGTAIARTRSFTPLEESAIPDDTDEPLDGYRGAAPISSLYAKETDMIQSLEARPFRVWTSFLPTSFFPDLGYTIATGAYIGLFLGNIDVLEHHVYHLHYAYYIRRQAHEFTADYRWSQAKWWIEVGGGIQQKTYSFDYEGDYQYFPHQEYWAKLQTGTEWHYPYLSIKFSIQYLLDFNEAVKNDDLQKSIDKSNKIILSIIGDTENAVKYLINLDTYLRPEKTSGIIAELELNHIHSTYRTIPGETGYRFSTLLRLEAPFLVADGYSLISDTKLSLSWSMPWIDDHVLFMMLRYGFTLSSNAFRNAFRVSSSTQFEFNEPLMLHGYPTGNIMGNQLLYGHIDYTFPVTVLQNGFTNVPIGLNRIGLGLYSEAAIIWNEISGNDFDIMKTKISMGIDLYLDGTLGYNYNFRLKIGYGGGLMSGGDRSYYMEFSFMP